MATKNKHEFEDLSSYSSEAEYKKSRGTGKWKKVLMVFLSLICVLMILVGCGFLYLSTYMFADLTTNSITKDPTELGITEHTVTEKYIKNIALFGVDTRSNDFTGRSDAILVLSVDQVHNKIKMISLLRDIRVYMGDDYTYTGTGYDKITHAYQFGGPEYTIKVINQNFNLDITDYVTVNFTNMAKIVDAVGGVDLEITDGEVYEINKNLDDNNPDVKIYESGLVHLNGDQAVAYARIRNIGSDNGRAERQQKVLTALLDVVVDMPVSSYPETVKNMCALCETSLDFNEIMGLAPIVLNGFTIEKTIIPDENIEGFANGFMENGGWMWTPDLDVAAQHIYELIYEPENTEE